MVARPGPLGFVLLTRDVKEGVSTEKTHYENSVWRSVLGRGMWVEGSQV